MRQGVYFQRWATKGDQTAPDPSSGTDTAWLVSSVILGVWLTRRLIFPDPQYSGNSLEQLMWAILTPSRDFVLAILIASVPPGVVALLKLAVASSIIKRSSKTAPAGTRSPVATLIVASLSLVELAANIAAIITFLNI